MQNLLLVMLGGAVGSALRYGVSVALSLVPSSFPLATILVNIVGSFVLGFVVGTMGTPLELHPSTRLVIGTGICGGFTTYSAFSVESVQLWQERAPLVMGTYILATIVACFLAAWGGTLVSKGIVSN